MLGDLIVNYPNAEYRLVVCTPSRIPLGELVGFVGFEYTEFFSTEQSQISFTMNKIVDGVENTLYPYLLDKNLILLIKNDVNVGYFRIERTNESIYEGNSIVEVQCDSAEIVLAKKRIYSVDGTYTISQLFALTFGEKAKSWAIGTIDAPLQALSRTFDISETTLLDLCYNYIQKSFDCVVQFDTLNKVVNFKSKSLFSTDTNLYVAFENFQKHIGKESLIGDVVTRLYVYGKDDISINEVNPNGKFFIDNFDYYKSYMSASLKNAVNAYEALLDANDATFQGYLQYISDQQSLIYGKGDIYIELAVSGGASTIVLGSNASSVDDYYNGRQIFISDGTGKGQERTITDYVGSTKTATVGVAWATVPDSTSVAYVRQIIGKTYEYNFLTYELYDIQIEKDSMIAQNKEYSALNAQETAKQAQVDAKKAEIDAINANIDATEQDISDLATLLSYESNFTVDQLEELDDYIIEDTYKDDGFAISYDVMSYEERIAVKQQLLASAEVKLGNISTPRFTTNIEIGDIYQMFEYQHQRDKLVNGAVLMVEYAPNVTLNARVVKIHHAPQDSRLEISLSNAYALDDSTFSFLKNWQQLYTASSNNNFERDKYNYYLKNDATKVNDFISNPIDASKNALVSESGTQEVKVDERGIWLRKKNPLDPTGYDPYQLRLLSNVIVFSKDYFQTSALAMTANGLNGLAIEDGTLDVSKFFTAPDGVIQDLVTNHLRTSDSDADEETTNFTEIVDKRISMVTGQRLYWTTSGYTTKTTTATAYPTRDFQFESLGGQPLFLKTSENPEDDMTTTPNAFPVMVWSKSSGNKLYYTSENPSVSTTTTTPTKVLLPFADSFADNSYYLPKTEQYQIGGQNAYWTVEPTRLSTLVNDFPYMQHQYALYEKFRQDFSGVGSTAYPIQTWGVGTGTGDRGKGLQYKDANGMVLEYSRSTDGKKMGLVSTDDGAFLFDGAEVSRNIYVQSTAPADVPNGSVWIDTDNYSMFDVLTVTVDTTLLASSATQVLANGTLTVTLPTAVGQTGVYFRIVNIGTGTVTVSTQSAQTVKGSANKTLTTVGEEIHLVSDGSNWW